MAKGKQKNQNSNKQKGPERQDGRPGRLSRRTEGEY